MFAISEVHAFRSSWLEMKSKLCHPPTSTAVGNRTKSAKNNCETPVHVRMTPEGDAFFFLFIHPLSIRTVRNQYCPVVEDDSLCWVHVSVIFVFFSFSPLVLGTVCFLLGFHLLHIITIIIIIIVISLSVRDWVRCWLGLQLLVLPCGSTYPGLHSGATALFIASVVGK